jgi:phytoene synthase
VTHEELDAAHISDEPLRAAYAFCALAASRGNHATQEGLRSRLPLSKRPYWDALMAFCGYADDCADDPAASPEERRHRYDRFADRFLRILHDPGHQAMSHDPELLLCLAFSHFVRTWHIDEDSIRTADYAVRDDIGVSAYESWADLERYLNGACAHPTLWFGTALGLTDGNTRGALAWGYGLGILDLLIDLEEDARAGKLYLPLDDLRNCRVQPADIERALAARRLTEPLRRLLRLQADRALGYFAIAEKWAAAARQDRAPERAFVLHSIAEAKAAIDHITRH